MFGSDQLSHGTGSNPVKIESRAATIDPNPICVVSFTTTRKAAAQEVDMMSILHQALQYLLQMDLSTPGQRVFQVLPI
jgi:hypothetical protein